MRESRFLKELMLIRQANQKSVIFVTKGFKFQPHIYAIDAIHDLVMMSLNLNDTAILNIERADHSCTISRVSKSKTIKK